MAFRHKNVSGFTYSSCIEGLNINAVRKSIGYLVNAFMVLLILNLPLHAQTSAQGNWKWPEKPQNIQVLSKELTGRRLRAPMRGFASALGVTCTHCHVGEEGKPFSTYDFASDENPNKDRAREMLRMLGSINEHLSKIEPSGDERVNLWCHTCHRGLSRPMTLGAQLRETYRAKGIEASLTQYSELKEEHYGKGSYTFTESALNSLGYQLLSSKNFDGAVKAFELNTKEYPKSGNVWDSLAESYMVKGDMKKAKKYYSKSLKLDPDNQNAKDMLKKLKESK